MRYLLFANAITGSQVLKELCKMQKPEATVTFLNHHDSWKRLSYRIVTGKFTVEDRCRFLNNVPFYDYRTLNKNLLRRIIQEYDIEIGFIATFSKIIPQKFVELFPRGLYNLHPSLLPAHAGVHPFFWVIYHNEQYSGTTCHLATRDLDGGDILMQTRYKINGFDSRALYDRYCQDCRKIIGEVIKNYDNLTPVKQNSQSVSFDPRRIPSDEALKTIATSPQIRKHINKALKFYNRSI